MTKKKTTKKPNTLVSFRILKFKFKPFLVFPVINFSPAMGAGGRGELRMNKLNLKMDLNGWNACLVY